MNERQVYADDFFLWEREVAEHLIDVVLPPLIEKVRDARAAR